MADTGDKRRLPPNTPVPVKQGPVKKMTFHIVNLHDTEPNEFTIEDKKGFNLDIDIKVNCISVVKYCNCNSITHTLPNDQKVAFIEITKANDPAYNSEFCVELTNNRPNDQVECPEADSSHSCD